MTIDSRSTYYDDPLMELCLQNFQEERWEEGLKQLDELLEKYPFEPSVRRFRQEVLVKARIDEYELEEVELLKKKRFQNLLTRAGIALAFLVAVILGATTFSGVIRQQVTQTTNIIEGEFSIIELSVKFRNGQNLLNADKPEDALVLFEEIRAEDPDYENLSAYIEQAKKQISLVSLYEEANEFFDRGELTAAKSLYEQVEEISPRYLDVQSKLELIEQSLVLEELINEADSAYTAANWNEAIAGYEAVRIANSNFQTEHVEERLFTIYILAAEEVVQNPEAELKELEIASGYLQKALALRPQDEEVKRVWENSRDIVKERLVERYLNEAEAALVNQEDSLAALEIAGYYFEKAATLAPDNDIVTQQAELAVRYLTALKNFNNALWDLVIEDLEYVFTYDEEYASGTGRQTLYDAYIIRGTNYIATGEYEFALTDFRRSIEISETMPEENTLSKYEAQLKVALTLGLMFDYEGAVLMYQSAVQTGDLRNRFLFTEPDFVNSIFAADLFAQQGSFRLAYVRYRDLFNQNELVYSEFVTHVVQADDYLSKLARQYGSSVQAIVRANDITDANKVFIGQELIIPIFTE